MRVRAWATLLLLVGLTAAEFVVFVLVVQWIGPLWAVLAALVTSTVGMVLLRREGIRAWRRFRRAVDAGEPPGVRVADGLVGLVGALLLVVPGFVTDVLGLLLVAPPTRWVARRAVQRVAERQMPSRMAGDVFGPRRVRLRRSRARPGARPDEPAPAPQVPGQPGPVLEGEIIEPGVVEPGDRP